jgi:hypothetical protein
MMEQVGVVSHFSEEEAWEEMVHVREVGEGGVRVEKKTKVMFFL